MAISGDSAPQFTTIAHSSENWARTCRRSSPRCCSTCDRLGLIGRQMFAIDGVKLPSNADKRRSGTHAELRHEAERMEAAVATMMKAHRARDEHNDPAAGPGEGPRRGWSGCSPRQSASGSSSPRTRNDARRKGRFAKATSRTTIAPRWPPPRACIQGYTAVAAVDCKAQIIVAAQAHGSGSEQSVLLPMVQSTEALRTEQTLVTADAGYHSKENLQELYERGVPALIADNLMRRRDERFKDQAKYKAATRPAVGQDDAKSSDGKFTPADFQYDPTTNTLHLPCREEALLDRASLHDERPGTPQVPGSKARLCPLPPPRSLLAPPGAHPDAPGRVLREEPSFAARVHRAHEGGHRQRARAGALRPTNRHRGTGVRAT